MSEPTGQFWIEGKNLGETIETIQRWARHTFPLQSIPRVLSHLKEEHEELQGVASIEYGMSQSMYRDQDRQSFDRSVAGNEIADNVMLLAILADLLGIDLLQCLQEKHIINLAREWADSGKGHDKHVEGKS